VTLVSNPITPIVQNSFYAFVVRCFQTLNPTTQFEDNWHIKAICYHLELCRTADLDRLIINVPPRHLKSLIVSIAYPAWLLGLDPSRRIVVVSYAQDLSNDLSRQFRAVMNSAWYRAAFPGTVISKNTEAETVTTKNGCRMAASSGGGVTGFGFDVIIMDDILKAADAFSKDARDSIDEWLKSTLMSRFNDQRTGIMILVMQRLHEDDPTGRLLKTGNDWYHLNLPAIAELDEDIPTSDTTAHHRKEGDLLHPARMPKQILDKLKANMGSMIFAAQYQQHPIPEQGNLAKRAWFQFYGSPPLRLPNDKIILSLDTAVKAGQQNDYSVGIIAQLHDEKLYLLDVWRERVIYPDLKHRLEELRTKFQVDTLLVEDSAVGSPLIQELKGYSAKLLIKPEGDKTTRLSVQTDALESGMVCLPRNGTWVDEFLDEVTGFPVMRHDDQVDALTQLMAWVRQQPTGTFSYDMGWDDCDKVGWPYPDEVLRLHRKHFFG